MDNKELAARIAVLEREVVLPRHRVGKNKARGEMYGLIVDKLATRTLRDHSWLQRYKDTVLVFRK